MLCISIVAAWAASTATAWALQGSSCSSCGDIMPTTSTTRPGGSGTTTTIATGAGIVSPPVTTGRPALVERGLPATEFPPASSGLPVTGGDIVGLVVLGSGAGTAGMLLLRAVRQGDGPSADA
jgi:hypothetical protein